MEINGWNRSVPPVTAAAPVVPAEEAATHRDIVQAVKALNATEMFGPENELLFQRDARTQRMVIRIVNKDTKEVVSQVPAKYVLTLAADLKKP